MLVLSAGHAGTGDGEQDEAGGRERGHRRDVVGSGRGGDGGVEEVGDRDRRIWGAAIEGGGGAATGRVSQIPSVGNRTTAGAIDGSPPMESATRAPCSSSPGALLLRPAAGSEDSLAPAPSGQRLRWGETKEAHGESNGKVMGGWRGGVCETD